MNIQPGEIKIGCPHCGQHLVLDSSMLGMELECPICRQTFLAAGPDASVAPPPSRKRIMIKHRAPNSASCGGVEMRGSGKGKPKRSRGRAVVVGLVVVLAVAFFLLKGNGGKLFDSIRGNPGISIAAEEIILGKTGCSLIENGKGFRTNGRELFSYQIPLRLQSDRISFEVMFHEEKEGPFSPISITLGPYMFSGKVNIQRDVETFKLGKWVPVDVRLREKEVVVVAGGRQKSFPRPEGVRINTLLIGNEVDFSVRNVRTYPSVRHMEASDTYETALSLAGEANLDRKLTMIGDAARMGLAEAQYTYAAFCSKRMGVGGSLSDAQVAEWIRRAAEQGYSDAQCVLGSAYQCGDGSLVRRDEREALRWLRKAANGGSPKGALQLSLLLLHGKVVDHNAQEAQRLLQNQCEGAIIFDQADDFDNDDKGLVYFLLFETYVIGGEGATIDKSKGLEYLRTAASYGYEDAIDILRSIR